MRKIKTLTAVISFVTALFLLAPAVASPVYAEGTHGFYMTCDGSVVDNKADGFMIDVYSDSADALATYWSNANWDMYTLETQSVRHYTKMEGGGSYAGIQILGAENDRVGIMAMWKYTVRERGAKEDTDLYAKVMYGKAGSYDNEGSGSNCIMPYAWKSGQWYRQLLYCWTDDETGDTMIGTWFYDYEADKWTLFSYFDTFLVNSCIKGNVNQFLENFNDEFNDRTRSFRYKNVYFLSHETKEWVAQPNLYVYSDSNVKAVGEATCGVSDDKEYIWGSVNGSSSKDTDSPVSVRGTLNTPEKPTYGLPEIGRLSAGNLNRVMWNMSEHSTPQLSYELVVTDRDGNILAQKAETRPEVNLVRLGKIEAEEYTVTLTVTDVFGNKTQKVYRSGEAEETDAPAGPEPAEGRTVNVPLIVGLAVGSTVAVAVAAAVVIFIVLSKKKKKA